MHNLKDNYKANALVTTNCFKKPSIPTAQKAPGTWFPGHKPLFSLLGVPINYPNPGEDHSLALKI